MLKQELARRNLPDLFCMPDGKRIETKEEWENIARPYWSKLLLQEEL